MTEGNKLAFDKLVAETADNPPLSSDGLSMTKSTGRPVDCVHYDVHELNEIKEAIEDYYD